MSKTSQHLMLMIFAVHFSLLAHGAGLTENVPFMNLIEYRDELLRDKKADDECPMNLRLRPTLRSLVINDGHDYDWIVKHKYSQADQKIDADWVRRHQAMVRNERTQAETSHGIKNSTLSPWAIYNDKNLDRLARLKFYPGFYSTDNFASYQIGLPHMPWGSDRGFTFKIFFEFKNPEKDLTPERYREFSKELSNTSFEGDSKIPMLSGWIRFTWNNVIVHATSIQSAKIAESLGLKLFGDRIASYSRGVDVRVSQNPLKVLDWPHFLCASDPTTLPGDVLNFVQDKP